MRKGPLEPAPLPGSDAVERIDPAGQLGNFFAVEIASLAGGRLLDRDGELHLVEDFDATVADGPPARSACPMEKKNRNG